MNNVALRAVPTLDALAADPAQATGLPREALLRLLGHAQAAQMACVVALAGPPTNGAGDELLTVPEAARRLGMSPWSLYKRSAAAPYNTLRVDLGTRSLRFSARAIEQFKQRRTG